MTGVYRCVLAGYGKWLALWFSASDVTWDKQSVRATSEVCRFARWSMDRSATRRRKSHSSVDWRRRLPRHFPQTRARRRQFHVLRVQKSWYRTTNSRCGHDVQVTLPRIGATCDGEAVRTGERRVCSCEVSVRRKEHGREIADNRCQWPTKRYGTSTCRCPWWRGLTPQPVSSQPSPWYLSRSVFYSVLDHAVTASCAIVNFRMRGSSNLTFLRSKSLGSSNFRNPSPLTIILYMYINLKSSNLTLEWTRWLSLYCSDACLVIV